MSQQSPLAGLQPQPYQPKQLMPDPQAALGALLPALLQAAKQPSPAASQAGSALAQQSHPQTLGQPPKQGNTGVTSGQAQPNPSPALPQSVGGSASAPPGQLGAAQAGGVTPGTDYAAQVNAQINALQQQAALAQKNQNDAMAAMQSAIATPQPTMPTYTAPTMAPQNPGMAIGAALAALFAPKYAQGPIGALGVDQENRQKAYDNATTAAKTKWDAQLSGYEDAYKARQDAIGNQEKIATAAGTQLTRDDTAMDNLLYRQQELSERAASLAEKTRVDNERAREYFLTREDRQSWRDTLRDEASQRIGISRERLKVLQHSSDLKDEQFRFVAKRFNITEADKMKISTMMMSKDFVIEANREASADRRLQNGAAFRAVMQGEHDLDTLLTQASGPTGNPAGAAAAMEKLRTYDQTPNGQRMLAGFQAYGLSPSLGSEVYDSILPSDTVLPASPEKPAPGGIPAPGGTAAPGSDGLPGLTPDTGTPEDNSPDGIMKHAKAMMAEAQGITSDTLGTHKPKSVDDQVKEELPGVQRVFAQHLAERHGDVQKAWALTARGFLANPAKNTPATDPAVVSRLHDLIFKGLKGGAPTPQPTTSPNPSATQSPQPSLVSGVPPPGSPTPAPAPSASPTATAPPPPQPTNSPSPSPRPTPTALPTVPASSDATPAPNKASHPMRRPQTDARRTAKGRPTPTVERSATRTQDTPTPITLSEPVYQRPKGRPRPTPPPPGSQEAREDAEADERGRPDWWTPYLQQRPSMPNLAPNLRSDAAWLQRQLSSVGGQNLAPDARHDLLWLQHRLAGAGGKLHEAMQAIGNAGDRSQSGGRNVHFKPGGGTSDSSLAPETAKQKAYDRAVDRELKGSGPAQTAAPKSPQVGYVARDSAPAGPETNAGDLGKASVVTGVPLAILVAVAHQESGFRQSAVSPAGAIGTMQLMPGTAKALGVNPNKQLENIIGGARYLKQMYEKYHSWRKALAAYNAGSGAVDRYGDVPPYAETQNYVKNVLSLAKHLQQVR